MSQVEFKKWPCRPVDARGQGPYIIRTSMFAVLSVLPTVNVLYASFIQFGILTETQLNGV